MSSYRSRASWGIAKYACFSIDCFFFCLFSFCLWDFRKTSDQTTDRLCFAWLLLRRRLKIYLLYLTDSVCCSDGWCGWEWMDESEWLNWVKWMVSDESLSVYAARLICISNNTFLCCFISRHVTLSLSVSIFLNIEKRRRSASFHAQGNNEIQTKTTLQLKRIQQTNKAKLSQ